MLTRLVRAFAAGVIAALALVHIIPGGWVTAVGPSVLHDYRIGIYVTSGSITDGYLGLQRLDNCALSVFASITTADPSTSPSHALALTLVGFPVLEAWVATASREGSRRLSECIGYCGA